MFEEAIMEDIVNKEAPSPIVELKLSKEEEEYLEKLTSEKKMVEMTPGLDWTQKLLNSEIERILSGGKVLGREENQSKKFCDVTKDKPIKVTVRAVVPVKDHPKFNFVGKLLGPKGNSLKRLQEETLTKMAILGRGSMRDKHKEEECRQSNEPRYKHLTDDLHVEITAYAAPAEAHARIALALTEIRRFLVPDYNDDIRQEQLREMQMMNAASCLSDADNSPLTSRSSSLSNSSTTTIALANQAALALPPQLASNPALANPLRAMAYPAPVVPLVHPAFRGICKPAQALAIGLTQGNPLLPRYRQGVTVTGGMAGGLTRRPGVGVVGRKPKDDYSDPTADVNMIELCNRYSHCYEGSDGLASPDDRDEGSEDLHHQSNGNSDFSSTLEAASFKVTTTLDRSRFRHEPYARYPAKVAT